MLPDDARKDWSLSIARTAEATADANTRCAHRGVYRDSAELPGTSAPGRRPAGLGAPPTTSLSKNDRSRAVSTSPRPAGHSSKRAALSGAEGAHGHRAEFAIAATTEPLLPARRDDAPLDDANVGRLWKAARHARATQLSSSLTPPTMDNRQPVRVTMEGRRLEADLSPVIKGSEVIFRGHQ